MAITTMFLGKTRSGIILCLHQNLLFIGGFSVMLFLWKSPLKRHHISLSMLYVPWPWRNYYSYIFFFNCRFACNFWNRLSNIFNIHLVISSMDDCWKVIDKRWSPLCKVVITAGIQDMMAMPVIGSFAQKTLLVWWVWAVAATTTTLGKLPYLNLMCLHWGNYHSWILCAQEAQGLIIFISVGFFQLQVDPFLVT